MAIFDTIASKCKSSLIWSDKLLNKENNKQPVYCITFKPDGTQLLACCGSVVLVYNSSTGELIETLKSHKDTVYCVDFNFDGKRFATGSADKSVIIWDAKFEGLFRYSHSDSVQVISHNPVNGIVLSCACSDFGLWMPEQKSVNKFKVGSRIVSCAWTFDGLYFALGLFNGIISIRNKHADEVIKIERKEAVWSLAFNPITTESSSTNNFVVVDWDGKLSQYQINGNQIGKDKYLNSDPCCVDFFSSGEYFILGGSDGKISLWTRDLIKLGTLCDRNSWVWSCKVKPKQNYFAVGTNDGTLSLYSITFHTVHGLYHDSYAFREKMTNVVIQDLTKDKRYKIECKDYVKKISIYKDFLAVQLSDKTLIYEKVVSVNEDVEYCLKETITRKLDCNLLVITGQNIILCLEKRLQMLNLKAEVEREWHLDTLIRYIKVVGGPIGKEGLLVGLKDGQVLLIYLDNPFPILLHIASGAVRCLDLSQNRSKVAIVDERGICTGYDLSTKSVLFQESGASSVAWNKDHGEMVCFSGNGYLHIIAGSLPSHSQKLNGFVVGFKGSKIFCLSSNVMTTIDVPQSASMLSYLEQNDLQRAYKIACLGVTDQDWSKLAIKALENLDFKIAKKSFIRIRDFRSLNFIKYLEKNNLIDSTEICKAEMMLHQGYFHEAAMLFKKSGNVQRAVEMYSDLNMTEDAARIVEEPIEEKTEIRPVEPTPVVQKTQEQQSNNNINNKDSVAAAQGFVEVGDYYQAAIIYGQNNCFEELLEMARKIGRIEIKALSKCVEYFKSNANYLDASVEILIKMGNIREVVELYVSQCKWDDAFKVSQSHPELQTEIFLPYANWLILNDRYLDAITYYRKAGSSDVSINTMKELLEYAIDESRFSDASYFSYLIAREYLTLVPDQKINSDQEEQISLDSYYHFVAMAEFYYIYDPVFRYLEEPFIDTLPEALFNMSRFLLHASLWGRNRFWFNEKFPSSLPPRINLCNILYVLAKLSSSMGAYKLERYCYERLQSNVAISKSIRRLIEYGFIASRGHPDTDSEELNPTCWSCGSTNPLLHLPTPEDLKDYQNETIFRIKCIECESRFHPAFFSFENVGLVEYDIDSSLEQKKKDKDLKRISWTNKYEISLGKKCIKTKYYREAVNGVHVTMCNACHHFFHSEDYEYCIISKGGCPFCKTPPPEDFM